LEHPILQAIRREGFTPFGWFEPGPDDGANGARFIILIGNAGLDMFRRFATSRDEFSASMDEWTKHVVDPLAATLGAEAIYPFDTPPRPFLTWARKAGAGHVSPLGLNIHPDYGLWHAFRAALLFPVVFDLPRPRTTPNPCDSCEGRPCLSACPVHAFDGTSYDLAACGKHVLSAAGDDCLSGGCKARLACPVGRDYIYHARQIQFHMRAFHAARLKDLS
jgi:epoxyqueuosine reductase QueG